MIKIQLSKVLGDKRIKQAELARLTGIRPNTINDLYHGMVDRINLDHLDRICEVLNCDISDIISYTPSLILKTGKKPMR